MTSPAATRATASPASIADATTQPPPAETSPDPVPVADAISISSSDHLRLTEHVTVNEDQVIDSLTGRHLRINGSARIALRLIAAGGTFNEITGSYGSAFGIGPDVARRDVRTIATSLDTMSMLVLTPHLPTRLRPSALWGSVDRLIRLEWDTPSARRYPGTLAGLLRAVTRSGRWSLLGATVSALLLLAVLLGFSTGADTPGGTLLTYGEIGNSALYALTPLLINMLLLGQLAAHEAGHLLAATRYRTVNYVAVRGLRLYVAHGELRPGPTRLIALAGPIGGVLGTAATAAAGLLIGLGPLVSGLLAAMSVPHLWSLTPWSSDGKYIWARAAGDAPATHAAGTSAAVPTPAAPVPAATIPPARTGSHATLRVLQTGVQLIDRVDTTAAARDVVAPPHPGRP